MPPLDPESFGKLVTDGFFLKIGEVMLIHGPSVVKKGVAVVVVIVTKKLRKTGDSKRERLPVGRKNKRD